MTKKKYMFKIFYRHVLRKKFETNRHLGRPRIISYLALGNLLWFISFMIQFGKIHWAIRVMKGK